MNTSTGIGREIEVGVVGLGDHARRSHVTHLAAAGAHLVAVFDPDESSTAEYQGSTVTVHHSLPELLDNPSVEAVIICSPDRFHAGALAAAVAAGKHVLVEKPVAATYEELAGLADSLASAHQKGLVVSSCHPRRFDPPFVSFRARLGELSAQMGNPLTLAFDFFYHRPSKSGLHHGLLIDHVNHEIDLLNWFFGYSDFTATRLYDNEVRYAVAGVRADGISFSFAGSRHLDRRVYAEALEVRFERGLARVDAEAGTIFIHDYDAGDSYVSPCDKTDYLTRFQALNDDFFAAIRHGTAPYLTAQDLVINTETGIFLTENGTYDSHFSVAHELG